MDALPVSTAPNSSRLRAASASWRGQRLIAWGIGGAHACTHPALCTRDRAPDISAPLLEFSSSRDLRIRGTACSAWEIDALTRKPRLVHTCNACICPASDTTHRAQRPAHAPPPAELTRSRMMMDQRSAIYRRLFGHPVARLTTDDTTRARRRARTKRDAPRFRAQRSPGPPPEGASRR